MCIISFPADHAINAALAGSQLLEMPGWKEAAGVSRVAGSCSEGGAGG